MRLGMDGVNAPQKDGGHRTAATEIQHPHAGFKVEQLAQPFREPQGIGAAAPAGEHPLRVIAIRARETRMQQAHRDRTGDTYSTVTLFARLRG